MNKGIFGLALAGAVLLAGSAWWSLPRGLEAARAVAAADDPVALSDLALATSFNAPRASQEMIAALEAGDAELAQSMLELAEDRGLAVAPELVARVRAANAPSRLRDLRAVARGFFSGEGDDGYSLAGTVLGDLFVFGDVRDGLRESSRLARGAQADPVILALAAAGIVITAGTYASAGAAGPARAGLSLAKVASRTGRIGAKLTKAIRLEKAQGWVRIAGDVGRVQAKAGTRAALDGLRLLETPKDATRLARLAEVKGGKTRAIVKLLGRGAIVLSSAVLDLAWWMFWAVVNLLGFCAALKRAAEAAVLGVLRRRRQRAAMRARALAGGAVAG